MYDETSEIPFPTDEILGGSVTPDKEIDEPDDPMDGVIHRMIISAVVLAVFFIGCIVFRFLKRSGYFKKSADKENEVPTNQPASQAIPAQPVVHEALP